MITLTYITDIYYEILSECKEKLDIVHWTHSPCRIELTNRKVLGTASIHGVVTISKAFVGTRDYDALHDTIRHELAHLAAGINEKHGINWKRMAVRFGATPRHSGTVSDDVKDTMYKYYILAHMVDGSVIACKPANKRTKKFTHYNGLSLSIRGVDISRFEYTCYHRGKAIKAA